MATAINGLTPERPVQRKPVLLVELVYGEGSFGILAEPLRSLEDEVAHEITGRKVYSSAVERLENCLGIVSAFKLNRNDGKPVFQGFEKLLQFEFVVVVAGADMGVDL